MKTTIKGSRGIRWLLFIVAISIAPIWLLTTSAGLRAALRIAELTMGERLVIGASAGRLTDTITLRDIAYSSETVSVRIAEIKLNLRLTRLLWGRVQAETFEIQALEIDTRRSSDPDPANAPLTLDLPLRVAVEQGFLRDFRLNVNDTREWFLPEVQFAMRWRGPWITVAQLIAKTPEERAVELRGRLAIIEDQIRFEKVHAQSVHGSLNIEGALGFRDAASELEVAWENLRPPNAASLHSKQGVLRLQGPWRDYAWTLQGDLNVLDTRGALRAHGRGDLQQLRVQEVQLDTLEGDVQGEGSFRFSGAAQAELALRWRNLNPGARFKEWPGQLTGAGSFVGEWSAGTPRLEFHARLEQSHLRGYPLTLRVNGDSTEQKVFLNELILQSGASTLTASGALLPQLKLSGELRSSDLSSLWAGMKGRSQLQVRLRGTPAAPVLELLGNGRELSFDKIFAARASINAKLAPQGASRLWMQLDGVTTGVPLRKIEITASGTRQKHSAQLAAQGEIASGSFSIEGTLANRGWRGTLMQAKFVPEDAEWVLENRAALRFTSGEFEIEPLCLVGNGSRTCWQLRASAARQYLAFRASKFDLRHLRALLPDGWILAGDFSGTASVMMTDGELHDLQADLVTSAGSLEAGGVKLPFGVGEFQLRPQNENLYARLHLTPAGGEVKGELALGPAATLLDRDISGQIVLRLPDLAWLPVLSPEIAAAHGAVNGGLKVAGTLRSPSLNGRLAISDGRVQLATPGIELTGINATFESTVRAPLALIVNASAGEGRLRLSGELQALRPQITGKFTLTGENAQLLNTPDIRAWAAPNLQLTLAKGTARLTGDIEVTGALITPRELGGGGIAPSADQVLVSEDQTAAPDALKVETEVRITLGDAVRFDGLGLKTRLTGAVTASDDAGRPTRARGELQLVGGRYKAYGQDLQIETGRLLFSGGVVTDPAIDIVAFREPRDDIRVGLRARGTLIAPNITLYSTPAMSQEEQLSWLVLGRSLSESLEGGQGGELAGAALSLGLSGGGLLAQRFGSRLGFDEVSLGARPGETAEKARLTIGKYLSPKLFVSYGVGLFQPGNYFRLQYDLGHGFKLNGESGVTSGGDLLYTIER